ncbi:MAG: response regulator, partial [Lachnospiraceae bacterium]|nr:response regulator [Lachnospiraceae bacterium]
IKSIHQNIVATVDGEEIYRYQYETTQYINEGFAPTQWISIPVSNAYEGKVLELSVESLQVTNNTCTIDTIYLGEKMAIIYHLLRENLFYLLTSLILMTMGVSVLFYFFTFKSRTEWEKGYLYMGTYILFFGLWFLCQTDVRQFFFENILFVRNMEFLCLMMIPVPLLLSLDNMQNGIFHQWTIRVCLLEETLAAIMLILSWLKAATLLELLWILYLNFVISIVFGFGTFFMIYRQDHEMFHRMRMMFYSYMFLGIWALVEIIYLSFIGSKYQGYALAIGMLGFSLGMFTQTSRRAAELRNEKNAAEARDRGKTDFLANMSHELRTPINAVLGMDEMILRESRDENITRYALNIRNAGKSLLSIINDILDFSKAESGKMELIDQEYDLSALINDSLNLISFKAQEKKLRLETLVSPDLPTHLFGDELRIRQALGNILNNAVKYTRHGKITLKVDSIGSAILEDGTERIYLRIAVKDTGMGIHKDDLERIFTKFERFDLNANRNIEGTGLGLAITRQIVDLMHGSLTADSVYGEGSTFTIILPQNVVSKEKIGNFVERINQYQDIEQRYQPSFTAPDARILVVDDNEMNLRLVQELLKHTKMKIDVSDSGADCLEKVLSRDYDLILMDHLMPEMDGIETLHHIRALKRPACENVPVVILTANAISGMREKFLKEGFAEFLPKPIDSQQMEHVLISLLPKQLLFIGGKAPWEMEEGAETEAEAGDVPHTSTLREVEAALMEDDEAQDAAPEKNRSAAEHRESNPGPAAESYEQETEPREKEPQEEPLMDFSLGLTYCMNERSIYRDVLKVFVDNYTSKREEIETAYQAGDWKKYTVHVHGLKSTSLTLGGKRLSAQARELEYAGKRFQGNEEPEKAMDYIVSHQEEMLSLYEETVEACRQYYESEQ